VFDEVCQQFRSKWLDDRAMADADGVQALDVADGHQADCKACNGWVRSTKQQIGLLMALPVLEAPEELDALVEHAVENPPPEERVEQVLAALPRKAAPSELGERLATSMLRDVERREQRAIQSGQGQGGERERTVLSVKALDIEHVPNVLERLIDEELESPAAHRAERMVGNLDRRHAPAILATRVAQNLRRHSLPRLVFAPLASLLAASLLLWVVVRGGGEEQVGYSFEVVRATNSAALNPIARQVAEALSAGANNAVREVRPEVRNRK